MWQDHHRKVTRLRTKLSDYEFVHRMRKCKLTNGQKRTVVIGTGADQQKVEVSDETPPEVVTIDE